MSQQTLGLFVAAVNLMHIHCKFSSYWCCDSVMGIGHCQQLMVKHSVKVLWVKFNCIVLVTAKIYPPRYTKRYNENA
jgi:hypothetical protein